MDYDNERTKFLEQEGYKVLRVWNEEVFKNIHGILATILHLLESVPN